MTAQAIARKDGQLDWMGILCSFGCAVHCAATPVLMAILPSLTSIRWLTDPLFHQAVAVICGVLVLRAILPDYRVYRSGRVVSFASIGMTLLFVAAFVLPDTCCARLDIVKNAQSDVTQPEGRLRLVSSQPAAKQVANLGRFQWPGIQLSQAETCLHGPTLSRPLLTALELESHLGFRTASALITVQSFLSPIGGLFLIAAHILNIRLRCCRRTRCRSNLSTS